MSRSQIDPIPQKDYYTFAVFFGDISPHGKGGTNHVPITDPKSKAQMEQQTNNRKSISQIREQLLPFEEALHDGFAKITRRFLIERKIRIRKNSPTHMRCRMRPR